MAIQIDGDSGISGVNGSATTPALQGTDSNTGIVFGTDDGSNCNLAAALGQRLIVQWKAVVALVNQLVKRCGKTLPLPNAAFNG